MNKEFEAFELLMTADSDEIEYHLDDPPFPYEHDDMSERVFEEITQKWPWTVQDIVAASPSAVPRSRGDQRRALMEMFRPSDCLFCGEYLGHKEFDFADLKMLPREVAISSRSEDFDSIAAWAAVPSNDGQRFQPQRRFLAAKIEALPGILHQGSLLRCMKESFDLTLAAVVLHAQGLEAWFEAPSMEIKENLLMWLDAMSPSTLCSVHPVIPFLLPHEGGSTELIYLASIGRDRLAGVSFDE